MLKIGACLIDGDAGAHLSPVPSDVDFVSNPTPAALDGDIQLPSGDLFYREIAVTTIAQYQRPMIEIDETETLSRIFSGFGTRLTLADFSPVPNTRRYVLNPARRWGFRPTTYTFSVRTAVDSSPGIPTPDAGGPYTTRGAVEHLLPGSLPKSIGDSDFERWIEAASAEIDSKVGRDYPVLASGWKFAAQPDTPATIAQIAQWLSASYAYGELKEINRGPAEIQKSSEGKYRALAVEDLALIRGGEIEVEGAGGQPLDTESQSPITTFAPTPQFSGTPLDRFF